MKGIITAFGAAGIALVAAASAAAWRPMVIWNATPSVPVGLYRLHPVGVLRVGDLVVAPPPPAFAEFFADRGYLPVGVPLIKPVAALGGTTVCREKDLIIVGGVATALALERDYRGAALPVWQGCIRLSVDQIFLLATARIDSLDGRYFGPTPRTAIVGRATRLWWAASP